MTHEHISTGPGQVTQSNAHLEGAQIFFYPSLFFSTVGEPSITETDAVSVIIINDLG